MKKINLESFKNESLALEAMMVVRGGSGETSTCITKTNSNSSDHDSGWFDSEE
jgi:hypothetical protein